MDDEYQAIKSSTKTMALWYPIASTYIYWIFLQWELEQRWKGMQLNQG